MTAFSKVIKRWKFRI